MISIRRIRPSEGGLYRQLRLASLGESPSGFSSTYDDALARSWSSWCEQADGTATGNDRCTLLAFADDVPVGICAVYRNEQKPDEGELLQFWVAPGARGTGVASELLAAALLWCVENRVLAVRAAVTAGNAHALRFYQKHGFAPISSTAVEGPGDVVLARILG